MEKLDKIIKERLQNREIKPSDAAWEKIAGQLGNPPVRRDFAGWKVAAVFVLIAGLIGLFIWSNSQSSTVQHMVQEEVQPLEKEPITPEFPAMEQEEIVSVNGEYRKEKVQEKAPDILESSSVEFNATTSEPWTDVDVEMESEQEPTKIELFINKEVEDLLKEVSEIEKQGAITDATIDSLLLEAQRKLLKNRTVQQSFVSDADALLAEVELELFEENEHPLFNLLKEEFFKIRTAVADRNN